MSGHAGIGGIGENQGVVVADPGRQTLMGLVAGGHGDGHHIASIGHQALGSDPPDSGCSGFLGDTPDFGIGLYPGVSVPGDDSDETADVPGLGGRHGDILIVGSPYEHANFVRSESHLYTPLLGLAGGFWLRVKT